MVVDPIGFIFLDWISFVCSFALTISAFFLCASINIRSNICLTPLTVLDVVPYSFYAALYDFLLLFLFT